MPPLRCSRGRGIRLAAAGCARQHACFHAGAVADVDASAIPVGIAWGILDGRRLGWRRRRIAYPPLHVTLTREAQ